MQGYNYNPPAGLLQTPQPQQTTGLQQGLLAASAALGDTGAMNMLVRMKQQQEQQQQWSQQMQQRQAEFEQRKQQFDQQYALEQKRLNLAEQTNSRDADKFKIDKENNETQKAAGARIADTIGYEPAPFLGFPGRGLLANANPFAPETPENARLKAARDLADVNPQAAISALPAASYGTPQDAMGPDGKPRLIVTDNAGNVKELSGPNGTGYMPIPKKGTVVRDANGNVLFEQGGWDSGANVGATPATQTDLQKDIVSAGESIKRMDEIAKDYKGSYLTWPGQGRAVIAKTVDKLTGNTSDKAYLQGQTRFKTGVEQFFNQYRKDITGAAAAIQELERLKQSMFNTDMSPAQFEAAYAQFRGLIVKTTELKKQYLAQGIPVDQIGKKIDESLFGGGAQFGDNAQSSTAQPSQTPAAAPAGVRRYNPETGRIE